MTKKKILILIYIFITAGYIAAQQAPYLSSPKNNARYIRTQKLVLSWYPVNDAEGYQVQVATSDSFIVSETVFTGRSNSEQITISDLTQNTSYWWRVKVDDSGYPWSDVWKFTTTIDPRPVTLLSPENGIRNLNPEIVEFVWSKDSVNFSFNFQLSNDPSFSDTLRNIKTSDKFIELTNLASGQQYYWRVRPFNSDELPGDWSDIFVFRTELKKSTLIYPSNFSNNRDTSITFRWSKITLASIYDFQLSLDEEFNPENLVADTSTTFDRIMINGMLSDSVYYWRVKSRNTFDDTSRWSEPYTFKTKLHKPSLTYPADKSRNNGIDEIILHWSAGRLFDTYRVQVAHDSLFRNKISDSYIDNNSAIIQRLDYNSFYYWRVNLRNDEGDTSYWSDYSRFKTRLNSPQLDLPENNSVLAPFNLSFTWHPVDSAESYQFEISESPLFTDFVIFEEIEDTTFSPDSLEFYKEYYWRVKAANSRSDTSFWSEANILNTSRFILSTLVIDTTINFSKTPVDTIASFEITNVSNDEVTFNNIITQPDTIFYLDNTQLALGPQLTKRMFVIADTSRIDTGLINGFVKLVPDSSSNEDTLRVDLNLLSQMAVLGFSDDTLFFDTTLSASPRSKNFRLNNRKGNVTLDIDRIYIEGDDADAFELTADLDKLGAGDSVLFNIKFDPIKLDSNKAYLVTHSNSYPAKIARIPIVGIGKGGRFSERTLNSLTALTENPFEAVVNSTRPMSIINDGRLPVEYKMTFANNYFRLIDQSAAVLTIQPGDTAEFNLHYITPNYDGENIDTLIISHNAVGKSPLKYILNAVYDSASVADYILASFKISGNNINSIKEGLTVPENTSIQASLDKNLLQDESNLNFKLNYFIGGPGKKLSAIKANDNKFIIPYQNVNENGLVFKGELFTKGSAGEAIDSLTLFELTDVQVVLNNYKTKNITVNKSVAAESPAEANVNWVLFGYPFESVLADSVFNDLGQTVKMEDGQWMVYEYDENSSTGFTQFNGSFLTAEKGYFIAQSIMESFDLSYTYDNSVTTRKLSDNIIELEGGHWNTISNPYTFDVEIDTPAVVYRYETEAKSYKLSSIMRPGEAYFVPPEISELKLKNFGEYYPVLFPKIASNADWYMQINFSGGNKSEELFLIDSHNSILEKASTDNLIYRKAPTIRSNINAGFEAEGIEYSVALVTKTFNNTYNIELSSELETGLEIKLTESGVLPEGISCKLVDNEADIIYDGANISINKNGSKRLSLIIGTESYISNELKRLESEHAIKFRLYQNYPNPFNPATTIEYRIPSYVGDEKFSSPTSIKLMVYDILGREVATLVNANQEPGNHSVVFDASKLPSGVYFYRLKSGNYTDTKKLIILK